MSSDLFSNPWFHWAFIAGGLLMFASGIGEFVRHSRRRRSWLPRSGHVVGTRLDDGQTRVQVAFEEAGQEVRFWNRYTSSGIQRVGRPVELLVNPANSADAVVVRGAAGGGLVSAVFIVAGLVFAAVGAGMAGWI
jgi:hypothetical protein